MEQKILSVHLSIIIDKSLKIEEQRMLWVHVQFYKLFEKMRIFDFTYFT